MDGLIGVLDGGWIGVTLLIMIVMCVKLLCHLREKSGTWECGSAALGIRVFFCAFWSIEHGGHGLSE